MEAIVGALGVVVGAVISGLFLRKKNTTEANKNSADATETITRIAMSMIEPLENKVNKLEKKINRYAGRIVILMGGIETLLHQMDENKISPCWQPEEWDPNKDDE